MTNGATAADRPFDIQYPLCQMISYFGAAPNATEDEVQRVRLPPNLACFRFHLGFCNSDHPQKEFCFTCLLAASADAVFKIRLRYSVVCFAVICTDTCSGANHLVNEPVVDRIPRNLFGEENYGFTKTGSPFLQIINYGWYSIPQYKRLSSRRNSPKRHFFRRTVFHRLYGSICHSLFVIFSRYAKYRLHHN